MTIEPYRHRIQALKERVGIYAAREIAKGEALLAAVDRGEHAEVLRTIILDKYKQAPR